MEGPAARKQLEPADLLPYGRELFTGVLTGGQPSVEQLEAAAGYGFRTVINLRGASEGGTGREEVEQAGMSYVSIPVEGVAGLTVENAQALVDALNVAEYPLIVHCGSSNRVGALFALKAFHLDGRSAEDALEIGRRAGLTRLESAVRTRLRRDVGP